MSNEQKKTLASDDRSLQVSSALNEIALSRIWAILCARRMLIVAVFGVLVMLAVVKVYFTPPVYLATIQFWAPTQGDIDFLTRVEVGVTGRDKDSIYTPDYVFQRFQRNFTNEAWFSEFASQWYSGQQGAATNFMSGTRPGLSEPTGGDSSLLEGRLEWSSPVEAVDLLAGYSRFVLDATSNELAEELRSLISAHVEDIDRRMGAQRMSSEAARVKQVALLDENIAIARALDLKKPALLEGKTGVTVVIADFESMPVYYRGYAALEAEKKALLNRKNNDLFVAGLEPLVMERALLVGMEVVPEKIKVARIPAGANARSSAIRPKAALTIAVAAVLGLVLGIAAALLMNSVVGTTVRL